MPTKSNVPSVDPITAVGAARVVLGRIAEPAQRARFARLPADELDGRLLERYAGLVDAADAAATQYGAVQASEGDALVPLATAQSGIDARGRMFQCVEYMVADTSDSVRRQLDEIRKGSGYRDLASDLVALATLYAEHAAIVTRDPKNYRASDAPDAWTSEIENRLEEVRSGKVELRSWDEVHAELRARLGQQRAR